MAAELTEPKALTGIVFVEEQARRTVAAAYPHTALSLSYLSHLGQFADHPGYDPRRTFTLTNTDDIPWLGELLDAFPDVTFSVAALTLMSDKLHALGRAHANLALTPVITHTGIREELGRASVYLDINTGAHVLDVVKAAYYLDLVVLTAARYAKAPGHSLIFPTAADLVTRLRAVLASPRGRSAALTDLHTQHGPLSTSKDYHRLL
jgi:hypothetical protein